MITTLLIAVALAAAPARAPEWLLPDGAAPVAPVAPGAPVAPVAPKRIVSLAPVVTETLFLVGAGQRVVGVTRFCDRPAEAAALTKVGGYVDISLEKVLSLKPDVVIAMPSLGQRALLEQLRNRGVPVLVVFGDSLAEVKLLTTSIGATVGAAQRASALNDDLDAAVRALRDRKLTPQRVAVVVGHDPLVVAGPGTFAAEALAIAGVSLAVPADAPMWPVWSAESLRASGADVLVVAEGKDAADKLRALVARALPEGKRPRVVAAPGAILMRPGPALVDDLAMLGALLERAP
jgi:iron complex transport system substrate-binding protein